MSLGIIGIDHVQITVPRALEAECLAFYREDLELKEIPKPQTFAPEAAPGFSSPTCNCTSASTQNLRPGANVISASSSPTSPGPRRPDCKNIAIEEESVAEGLCPSSATPRATA